MRIHSPDKSGFLSGGKRNVRRAAAFSGFAPPVSRFLFIFY